MNLNAQLTVLIRVEPGSLGPDGIEHVEGFCQVCQKVFEKTADNNFVWQIVPRYDKTLSEFSLSINGKRLSDSKAEQLLSIYSLNFDELEEKSMEKVSQLIDKFLGHEYD